MQTQAMVSTIHENNKFTNSVSVRVWDFIFVTYTKFMVANIHFEHKIFQQDLRFIVL